MQKSKNGQYYLRSAFQFSYLLIFLWAVVQLVRVVITGENPISNQMNRVSQLINKVDGGGFWLFDSLSYAVNAFCILFAAHLVRIYITLESMEDQEGHYSGFYDSFSPIGRFLEFIVRVAIIAIISLKVIPLGTFSAFSWFVFTFYTSLTVWSVLALTQKKSAGEAFLWSSIAGLLFSIILIVLDYHAYLWQEATVSLWIASVLLAYDLLIYFRNESEALRLEYWGKLKNPW
jgi:hypothetical protein